MAHFPDWKRLVETWTQAAQMRRSQAGRVAFDLAAHGRQATHRMSSRAAELAQRTRHQREDFDDAIDGLQRRLNVLGLARKRDVVVHSELVGIEVSAAIENLVELSRSRDQELQQTVRREIHYELRTLGLATKDDIVALETELKRISAQARAQEPDADAYAVRFRGRTS